MAYIEKPPEQGLLHDRIAPVGLLDVQIWVFQREDLYVRETNEGYPIMKQTLRKLFSVYPTTS